MTAKYDELFFFQDCAQLQFNNTVLQLIPENNEKFCENYETISVQDLKNDKKKGLPIHLFDTHGLLGQLTISDETILLFVHSGQLVYDIKNVKIYKIEEIRTVNLTNIFKILNKKLTKNLIKSEIFSVNKETKTFLQFFKDTPFHFSYTEIEDEKYLWNEFMIGEIKQSECIKILGDRKITRINGSKQSEQTKQKNQL
ncbi:hypothetical protein M153_12672000591, partial [Pseudoloma neurophilia]